MKSLLLRNFSFLSLIVVIVFLSSSCKKDSSPTTLYFNSLTAGGISLTPTVAPVNIPANATIIASMSMLIAPWSASPTTILLMRSYDSTYVTLNITVKDSIITIVPAISLGNGISYVLTFTGLTSTTGAPLAYYAKTFTTIGNFAPPGLVAYWNFEGNIYDQAGTYNGNAAIDLNYTLSFTPSLGQCLAFNGTSTIVEIPNGDQLLNTSDFSITFWVKANSVYHLDSLGRPKGQFVLGVGDSRGFEFEIAPDYSSCKFSASYGMPDNSTISEDLYFAGDGRTAANGGLPGWTYCADLTYSGGVAALLQNKWAFITCTYDHSTKLGTMYINGVKMKQQDFNLWPAGDLARNIVGMKYGGIFPSQENILALGFFHSRNSMDYSGSGWGNYYSPWANHFRGWLDELRIFTSALSAGDVLQMYNVTKP